MNLGQVSFIITWGIRMSKVFNNSFITCWKIQFQIRSKHGSHSVTHSYPSYSFKYTPDTEVILLLIQISTPRYSFRYALDTVAILSLIQILVTVKIHSRHGCHSDTHSDSDTTQICSRHGRHSDTHSDSNFRYSTDTLTDAILILIQLSHTV